ncbi:NADPH-dependent F420 reductase [Xanthomonas arboricola]|uniref:NADPH-dependent F420 reductase n=1 Tax=Xanthomonas arboricola TaxID=56448 RepID=UPI000CEE2009|nr:NAD(P)-binding domain-containing protein [Xanthomonas arboricola]PPU38814.1 NADPH-dependent F420 reductase [Xanthomonas arboricola pv. populi]
MKYAVIGTGSIGTAYAHVMADAGLELVIGDRQPEMAAALARRIGRESEGGGIAAAVKIADLVLLALPYPATIAALANLGDLAGKVLVDLCNPISADCQDLLIGLTDSAAEVLQVAKPRAFVVKAFNTIVAQLVPVPARCSRKLQVFVAADNPGARAEVQHLASLLGFVPVDAGGLSNSRLLESIGLLNVQLGHVLGGGTGSAPVWTSAWPIPRSYSSTRIEVSPP